MTLINPRRRVSLIQEVDNNFNKLMDSLQSLIKTGRYCGTIKTIQGLVILIFCPMEIFPVTQDNKIIEIDLQEILLINGMQPKDQVESMMMPFL